MINKLIFLMTFFFISQTALAGPPEITRFENHLMFPDIALCNDGSTLTRILDEIFIVKVFFDNNAAPIRAQLSIHEKNEMISSTGESISYPANFTLTVDLTNGTETATGSPVILTLPGIGPFIRDTGRLVFDAFGNVLFEAGNFDFGPMGDPSVFCDAF